MLKKLVLVVAGALAALVVAAPIASATETAPATHHPTCAFTGGDASAASDISGASPANVVTQPPVGGNNLGNIGNCSSFLNDNANGDLAGDQIPVLGSILG